MELYLANKLAHYLDFVVFFFTNFQNTEFLTVTE